MKLTFAVENWIRAGAVLSSGEPYPDVSLGVADMFRDLDGNHLAPQVKRSSDGSPREEAGEVKTVRAFLKLSNLTFSNKSITF